jgi:RimJ/RimL family protein N-acetyltransferase
MPPRSIDELFPMLGLTITAGALELRGLSDVELSALGDLAEGGIHPTDSMPFYVPWTDAGDLALATAQYHWRSRADFSPEKWSLHLGVWFGGTLVGVQGFDTQNFLVTRTGETGSWLGQAFQGRGIGTAMRQVICAFAFDYLEATEITSGAFSDNAASLAVSRKVGYRHNGARRLARRDTLAENHLLRLVPEWLVRGPDELVVHGVSPFRESIGL